MKKPQPYDVLWLISFLGIALACELEARDRERSAFLQGAETSRKIDQLRAAHPAGGEG